MIKWIYKIYHSAEVAGTKNPASFNKRGEREDGMTMAEEIRQEEAFLMYVDYTFYQNGQDLKVTGEITRGSVKVGDIVDVIGYNKDHKKIAVTRIRKDKKDAEEAHSGEKVDLYFSGLKNGDIVSDQVIATPDTVEASSSFHAVVTRYGTPGIPFRPIPAGTKAKFHFKDRSFSLNGTIRLPEGMSELDVGGRGEMLIELDSPAYIEEGADFGFKSGIWDLGLGKVF